MQTYKKFVTFSFDDGVTQDKLLIALLDKYGLKATFNVNSSLFGLKGGWDDCGTWINHTKVRPSEVRDLYKNHEIAVHTLTHPTLPQQDDEAVVYQVEEDRRRLSDMAGYSVVGMAYPNGGVNNDDRVAELIKNNTGVRYARTISSSFNFDLPKNLHRLNPSVYTMETDKLFELAEEFLANDTDKPQLFYIWGHAYEFDMPNKIGWDGMEKFCQIISGKSDIFYGTNTEVLTELGLL